MRFILILKALFLGSLTAFVGSIVVAAPVATNTPAELARRCAPQAPADPVLYSSDFRWGFSIPELLSKFHRTYEGGKRLPKRMYWDARMGSLVMPVMESWGGSTRVPTVFAESVRRHVEEALRLKYVDGIFFPDMGHSHFFVPPAKWKAITDKPTNRTNEVYEAFMNEPELKVLYHTAEQLQTLGPDEKPVADRKTQWRFHTRNLLGDNRAQGKLEIISTEPGTLEYKANTVGEIAGYQRWGAGFNISASKDGCYAYRDPGGETRFFDLSWFDLEPESRGEITDP